MESKKCTKCGEVKVVSEYNKRPRGFASWCRRCCSEARNVYRTISIIKKRENNTCIVCSSKIMNRRSDSRYCTLCLPNAKRELTRQSGIRNKHLYLEKYNADEKYRERRRSISRIYSRTQIKNLGDSYVRKSLVHDDGFSKESIMDNPCLIEIKRLIILTNRLTKKKIINHEKCTRIN